jgi:hypothetical protein
MREVVSKRYNWTGANLMEINNQEDTPCYLRAGPTRTGVTMLLALQNNPCRAPCRRAEPLGRQAAEDLLHYVVAKAIHPLGVLIVLRREKTGDKEARDILRITLFCLSLVGFLRLRKRKGKVETHCHDTAGWGCRYTMEGAVDRPGSSSSKSMSPHRIYPRRYTYKKKTRSFSFSLRKSQVPRLVTLCERKPHPFSCFGAKEDSTPSFPPSPPPRTDADPGIR